VNRAFPDEPVMREMRRDFGGKTDDFPDALRERQPSWGSVGGMLLFVIFNVLIIISAQ